MAITKLQICLKTAVHLRLDTSVVFISCLKRQTITGFHRLGTSVHHPACSSTCPAAHLPSCLLTKQIHQPVPTCPTILLHARLLTSSSIPSPSHHLNVPSPIHLAALQPIVQPLSCCSPTRLPERLVIPSHLFTSSSVHLFTYPNREKWQTGKMGVRVCK